MYPYNIRKELVEEEITSERFIPEIPRREPDNRQEDGLRKNHHGNPPNRRPPDFIPKHEQEHGSVSKFIDQGAIQNCLFSMTYVWFRGGRGAWIYPTFIGKRSLSGYEWTRFGWTFAGYDLGLIESFRCFG